jgi:hypothetical protein
MGNAAAPILIVSGPSGAGKSTVSRLVAAAFERSAVVDADAFMGFIASGWIEPNLPAAGEQNDIVGWSLVAAAIEFASGGYTTVMDGHLFPTAVQHIARAGQRRGVPVHYAVLRADHSTCWGRACDRPAGRWPLERDSFDALHARFAELDLPERHAIDASGPVGEVAARVHVALQAGTLAAAG